MRNLSLLLLLSVAASATELTLDDAIRLAWANDPAVAALLLMPETAAAREVQAGQRPPPEIAVHADTSAPFRTDGEWNMGIGVSQSLPRRERVELARALARVGGEAAVLHLHDQRRRLADEVRRLYHAAALAQAHLDLAQRQQAGARETHTLVTRRHAAGEISDLDLALLNLDLLRAEQALTRAEAMHTLSLQALRGRLRLPPASSPPNLVDDLATLLARTVPTTPPLDAAAQPALALAAHAVQEAEAALALTRASSRADWSVGAGVDFGRAANDATGRLENDPRLSVGAAVPWPRGTPNRGDILERQAAVRIAAARHTALKDDLTAETTTAWAALQTLQPLLARHHETLPAATPVPDSIVAAHARGEVSTVEFLQIRQSYLALERDYLDLAARYLTALATAESLAGDEPAPAPQS